MQIHVNPLKPLAALSLFLLLAAAPLQQATGKAGLGQAVIQGGNSQGGTLRDAPDEEGQPAEDAPQNQDDASGDPTAETPVEAEPEAAGEEASEPAEESGDSDEEVADEDESEDSDDEDE
jgi:hypothetical protein